MRTLFLFTFLLFAFLAKAQLNLEYQTPDESITSIIKAPKTPSVYISPDNQIAILFHQPNYPSIEELAQPEERLAGLRINPRTNGSSRSYYFNGITIKSLKELKDELVSGLPKSLKIENIRWAPDSKKIAFTNTKPNGLELWYIDIETLQAKKLTEPIVNDAVSGTPYEWMPNSSEIIVKSILSNRGNIPQKPLAPKGPVIQENEGEVAPVRTYQDLLQNKYDEDLFEYFTSSELIKVDLTGSVTKVGYKGIIQDFSLSPDGKYILVEKIHKPFSYLVPYYRFAITFEIIDFEGKTVKLLADIPPSENIPKGYSAVRTGPRNFQWRADAPATIYWTEALDEGDPKKEVDYREQVYYLTSPFNAEPTKCVKLENRFGGLQWFDDNIAIAREWWWQTRKQKTSFFKPNTENAKLTLVWDRSWEDAYTDPGDFLMTMNEHGKYVILSNKLKTSFYLSGDGASPEGNRPFVDEFSVKSQKTKRLWRSEAPYYESPYSILDKDNLKLLTRRESKDEQPNFFIRDLKNNKLTQITQFEHPYPQLKGIESEFVKYSRKDGLQLTGKLYLPKGYKKGETKLPVLMWAYPAEYKSADAAGQVKDSPYRFIRPGWWSPLLWLSRGYAIFDDPAMPIVGEGDEEPNDKFIEQLVANAEAAIDTLVEMGVADKDKIAIGGHSYGAFMTANLMAHSDLFAAGIARSGAYNRTLTPFGFQSEERTFWEAPDTYIEMSPFTYADKVNEPLLLIHGEADNNSGTYPMQSERFYNALKGHGATARLVMLPHESHSYRAIESILHMIWETDRWLEKYVKNKETKN